MGRLVHGPRSKQHQSSDKSTTYKCDKAARLSLWHVLKAVAAYFTDEPISKRSQGEIMAGYIAIAVAIVVILIPIIIYNRLIALKQTRQNAFADIDVQLKQRCDLIPNLV